MTYKKFCSKARIDPAASSSRARYAAFLDFCEDAEIISQKSYAEIDKPLQWRDQDDTTTRDFIENFLLIFIIMVIFMAMLYDKCN